MKQLVVLSGKGGTGKTSVTAALAHLASGSSGRALLVLADADVDAANLELVLAPHVLERHEFRSGKVATIDASRCSGCGECSLACRFDAIREQGGAFRVDAFACEGCAACSYVCPEHAIDMLEQQAGTWFRSASRYGPLFHAALTPGQENSGKLVALIKRQAEQAAVEFELGRMLVDGPPGIACPVIAAASGADLALVVTEPSVGGIHDLRRILDTVAHFNLPALVCINKCDLYPEGVDQIEAECSQRRCEISGRIPFDASVTEAMAHGQPVTQYAPQADASQALLQLWASLQTFWVSSGELDPLELTVRRAVDE